MKITRGADIWENENSKGDNRNPGSGIKWKKEKP